MMKTLFDLLKAMLNASLLLLALCLFLSWQLVASARDVSNHLTEISARYAPIHSELQQMTQEIAALNEALTQADAPDSAEMRFRLASLEEQLNGAREATVTLSQLPAQVVSAAVASAVQRISRELAARLPSL